MGGPGGEGGIVEADELQVAQAVGAKSLPRALDGADRGEIVGAADRIRSVGARQDPPRPGVAALVMEIALRDYDILDAELLQPADIAGLPVGVGQGLAPGNIGEARATAVEEELGHLASGLDVVAPDRRNPGILPTAVAQHHRDLHPLAFVGRLLRQDGERGDNAVDPIAHDQRDCRVEILVVLDEEDEHLKPLL